jgi:thiosulfate reductase cytochrome b subunit
MVGMPIETRAFAPSFKNGRNKFVSEDRLSRNFAFNISLISKASIVQEDCVASSSVDISQGPGVVSPVGRRVMYRHTLLVRITHWINALCFVFLLMSGLQIFNAHPALYWGNRSDFDRPFLSLNATQTDDGAARGVTTILGRSFTTTGFLGASRDENGQLAERGFPRWITIPSYQDLATGRRWHFFFAWLLAFNGIVYGANFLVRSRWRDFLPAADEWRSIPASLWQHLRLRFPKGDEALHYNVLQKVAYLSVLVVLPVLVLAGLTMSPAIDATFPFLVTLFGGRQSARAIHFLAAFYLIGFVFVHLVMVLISGFLNNMASMITGRYAIEENRDEA